MSPKRKKRRSAQPQGRPCLPLSPGQGKTGTYKSRGRRALGLCCGVLLIVAGAWAYSTSFAGVLVLDDLRAIARNPTIRTLWPPSTPLSPPTAATVAGRPVANLSLAINYALAPAEVRDVFTPLGSPANPGRPQDFLRNIRGYHLLNLLIHLASALALFGIVRRTLASDRLRPAFGTSAPWLALVVALVWLVHPLQTGSVTYLVQRVESLMGLFYLLTLYCAIRAGGAGHRRAWTACAIASCALGMATKEVMVTAPLMVWLWDRIFGNRARRRWPILLGLAATWLVLVVLVLHESRAPSIELGALASWRYLITQAGVIVHYLRLALVGSPLVFLYTWPTATSLAEVAPQAVLLAVLVALAVLAVVRRHPLGFAGAWFFLILAPTSSVLPIVTEVAAEQRMYLPLAAVVALFVIGVFLGGGLVLARVRDVRLRTRLAIGASIALTAALVIVLATETRARNRDYWSEDGLWRDTVTKQPANQRARVAYGFVLLTTGRFADAEAQLQAAVDLAATDPMAQARLGAAQAAQGKLESAIPHLERAVAARPDDVDAHRWLGQAYAMQRQDALAISHLTRALEVESGDPVLLSAVATLLADSHDPAVRNGARAVMFAERAVELTSRQDPRTLNVLAAAEATAGRFPEAAATAGEALKLARMTGNRALVSELEYRVAAGR